MEWFSAIIHNDLGWLDVCKGCLKVRDGGWGADDCSIRCALDKMMCWVQGCRPHALRSLATVHDPVQCGIVDGTSCIAMDVHPLCDWWVIHSYNPTAICSEFWKDAILRHPTSFRQASACHLRPFSSILKRVFAKTDLDCSFKWHCLK